MSSLIRLWRFRRRSSRLAISISEDTNTIGALNIVINDLARLQTIVISQDILELGLIIAEIAEDFLRHLS